MKIVLFSRKPLLARRPRWYFHITEESIGGIDEIVAQSEAYSRRIDALATARSLKAKIGKAEIVDV